MNRRISLAHLPATNAHIVVHRFSPCLSPCPSHTKSNRPLFLVRQPAEEMSSCQHAHSRARPQHDDETFHPLLESQTASTDLPTAVSCGPSTQSRAETICTISQELRRPQSTGQHSLSALTRVCRYLSGIMTPGRRSADRHGHARACSLPMHVLRACMLALRFLLVPLCISLCPCTSLPVTHTNDIRSATP